MRGIIIKVVVNAIAIWVATVFVPGVTLSDTGTTWHKVLSFAVVGAVFGVVNTFIAPVVKLLSIPAYIFTLGLVAFVINALMLKLVEHLSGSLGIHFTTTPFFWSTIGAAFVVSIVSMALNLVIDKD